MRARGTMPKGGHSLLDLWDCVKKEIIDDMICSEDFINQVKMYKENFFKYSLDGINLQEIRKMLQELQEANQKRDEIKNNVRQVDQNAEVWRYLVRMDDSLYFTCGYSIDYTVLKDGINHIYEVLDFVYHIVDEYLSS
jgi:hypothetical protein